MLPAQYQWLNNIGTLPRVVQEALKEYGTHEVPGPGDNPKILAWARELGISQYTHDSIAWCGLFMALVAHRAGKPVVPGPLWALNWARWGNPSSPPKLGDTLAFVRPGGGHVGLYVGEDPAAYHVLGGNESDQVTIIRIGKERLQAARNLYLVGAPESAKRYLLSNTGAMSSNEA